MKCRFEQMIRKMTTALAGFEYISCSSLHTSCIQNIMYEKCKPSDLNCLDFFLIWGLFRIYQLISTANPALFEQIRAGLAVLNSWQILNGPQDLFLSFTFTFLFIFLNMKPLSIECPNLTCIINQSQPECCMKYFAETCIKE